MAPPEIDISWLGRPQPAGTDSPALVVLHGYGSSERDLLAAVPVLSGLLPGVSAKVIAVRGGFPAAGRRFGYSWFPGPVWEQPPPQAVAEVADGIADAVAGVTGSAVWLGFSQGMCAAVTVLRRRPELVRAMVALSGFTFTHPQPADTALRAATAAGAGTPVFYGRDPADPRIPAFASAYALEFLRTSTRLEEHSYPGMGHSVSFAEIADVLTFLRPFLT